MKTNVFVPILISMIVLAAGSPALAGSLTLGAKASIYNPPEEGANPSLMYGFFLDYEMSKFLHARADASYTSYAAKDHNYSLMPITLNLIAHFIPDGNIDPYLGGGVGYYSYTADGMETSHTGAQAQAGLNFHIGGFSAAVEVSYIVPDINHSDVNSVSWGGWASGTTYMYVPF
jgi:opacity protein-like surface antigen